MYRLYLLFIVFLSVMYPNYLFAVFDEGYISNNNGDLKSGILEFRMAAERGDARAQCILGDLYYNGIGVTKDYAESLNWYKKAAEQDDVKAQTNLGFMYKNGVGVKKNSAEALR